MPQRMTEYRTVDPVVFLDRDNTLIENSGDLGDPAGVRLLPGVPEGLRRLKDAGFRLVVVTNQGGVARGRYGEADVDAMHARIAQLADELSGGHRLIDRFYYCPFHPEATVPAYRREHPWRKPQPGMLLQAAADLALDLDRGWMIGDKPRDVQAGRAAGVRTIMLGDDLADKGGADFAATSFTAAVERVLAEGTDDPADAAKRSAARTASGLALRASVERRGDGTRRPSRGGKTRRGGKRSRSPLEPLRRAMVEMVEEVRSDRTRRGEFGSLRIAAAVVQLAALVAAFFALLELNDLAMFGRWVAGAVLAQLLVIALLLFDGRP